MPIQRYSLYLDLEVKSQDSRGGDRAGRRGKADTHLAPTGQGREPLNPLQRPPILALSTNSSTQRAVSSKHQYYLEDMQTISFTILT